MPRRAIIVGAAPIKALGLLLNQARIKRGDLLIGVDGGTDALLRAGLNPGFAVGDWDSLGTRGRAALKSIPHLTLSRDKDRGDLYFAVRAALKMGASRLVCLGVTGGRVDHHLAALLDLAALARAPEVREVRAIGPEAEYHFVTLATGPWRANLGVGQTVSVFALGGEARGVTLQGFRFPLRAARLMPGSRGLSNVTDAKRCTVAVRTGCVAVVIPAGGV